MYRVFAWEQYYPGGGLNDLVFTSSNIEECWKFLASESYDHYQIVNEQFVVIVEG